MGKIELPSSATKETGTIVLPSSGSPNSITQFKPPVEVADGVFTVPGRPFFAHMGTKNRSFVEVSKFLEANNVQNSRFMLSLFDVSIANLDPHSPDLTDEQKLRISAEIHRSPWYFIREVVRVPVSGGTVPYILHLGNLFLTWCMVSNINTYLLLPRQNYKTVSACAIYLWMYGFGTKNSHFLFFNKELKDAQNNLKRVKDLMEELPDWIRYALINQQGDRNAIEYILSANRNNRIDPKPAATSLEHADILG